jgi:hypothetical protein
MLNAEFMLLKFRLFFYKDNPNEIDFIDNKNMINKLKKYNIKYKLDDNKTYLDLLYLKGKIFSQIYNNISSTETRLLVKKNKYYKNKKATDESYKMIYYNTLEYEQIMFYFNNNTRLNNYKYKYSYRLERYLPNYSTDYTTASEYKIIYDYLKYYKKDKVIKFKKVLNLIVSILIILFQKYNNNTIKCILKNIQFHKLKNTIDNEEIIKFKTKLKNKLNKQKHNIYKTKYFTNDVKNYLINMIKIE